MSDFNRMSVEDLMELLDLTKGDTTIKAHRKKSTLNERIQPCEACGYPLSHKHHLLSVAEFGENNTAVRLCPNCHEMFHIVERLQFALRRGTPNKKAERLVSRFDEGYRDAAHFNAFNRVCDLVDRAARMREWAVEHPDLVSKIVRRKHRR